MNDDLEKFDFSNFDFDLTNDDIDLNFDDEEEADIKELEDIKKRKNNQSKEEKTDDNLDIDTELKEQQDPFNENQLDDSSSLNNSSLDDNSSLDNLEENTDDTLKKIKLTDDIINEDLFNSNNDVSSDIIKMNEEIDNVDLFMKHMEQRGYQLESSRFLTKKFAEASNKENIYNINVTINNEVITAITGYDDNNKVITIPESILKVVQTDIDKALQQII